MIKKNNNIEGLTDNQIDALVSRAYSVGNVSDFPSAYKQFGNSVTVPVIKEIAKKIKGVLDGREKNNRKY